MARWLILVAPMLVSGCIEEPAPEIVSAGFIFVNACAAIERAEFDLFLSAPGVRASASVPYRSPAGFRTWSALVPAGPLELELLEKNSNTNLSAKLAINSVNQSVNMFLQCTDSPQLNAFVDRALYAAPTRERVHR